VPAKAEQDAEAREWVEASIWTERMLAALANGVKGGKWASAGRIMPAGRMPSSLSKGFSPWSKPVLWRANHDVETTN
jgi:hypothetical protein